MALVARNDNPSRSWATQMPSSCLFLLTLFKRLSRTVRSMFKGKALARALHFPCEAYGDSVFILRTARYWARRGLLQDGGLHKLAQTISLRVQALQAGTLGA